MRTGLSAVSLFIAIILLGGNLTASRLWPGFAGVAQAQASVEPERPRVLLDTRYTPVTLGSIVVSAGDNLQEAINAATPGTEIVLEAGASFVGNFTLPAKAGNDWIVIRTSDMAGIPAEGMRVNPALHAQYMPKIVSSNSTAAITALAGAHHYRFVGIEFAATGRLSYNVIRLGDSDETNAERQPGDIIIDRCYIHGNPSGDSRRGVTLNSRSTAVIDSHISEIHQIGADTQAIGGWNGPGPYKIVNNYLEAAGENLMLGGSDPRIINNVPADVEIRKNYFVKPLRWRSSIIPKPAVTEAVRMAGGALLPDLTYYYYVAARGRVGYNTMGSSAASAEVAQQLQPGESSVKLVWSRSDYATSYRVYRTTDKVTWSYYDVTDTSFIDVGAAATGTATIAPPLTGTRWLVKNLFELKNARRVLVDGNVFENCWKDGQTGYAILLKSTNSDGNAPWDVTEDVTFTNNIVRHAGIGISILGRGNSETFECTRRIKVENNLFYDINGAAWSSSGNPIQLFSGYAPIGGVATMPEHVVINHNTFFGSGYISVDGPRDGSGVGFVFTNNIVKTSSYCIKGTSTPAGDATLNTFFSAPVFDKNVFIGGRSSYFVTYLNDNYFHTDPSTVGFVDYSAGALDYHNYALSSGSPYHAAGLHPAGDGSDRGVNLTALDAAMALPAAPPPPPPPPPVNQPPQVSITASPTSGPHPLTVAFSPSASDPDGQVVAYIWDFGDGSTSKEAAPTHVYKRAGSFTARVTVADNAGATASASVVIKVTKSKGQIKKRGKP